MLKELVLRNRSCRGYNEDRIVKRDELVDMVDTARLTASASNAQPIKFYISYDKDEVESILPCTHWGGALPRLHLPFSGTHPTAFIVLLQDKNIASEKSGFLIDVGICAEALTLAATEKGLSTLMIRNFELGKLREVLDLTDNLVPVLVIAVGEKSEKIMLEDVGTDGKTAYWRTPDGVHHVPKRILRDVVIERSGSSRAKA